MAKKKYSDVELLQKKIDEYFESTEIPTMSGLALALDMDRRSLLNYSKDERFFPTIKKARDRVEAFVEERLMSGNATAGVIFNLKNNFGWIDKQEVDAKVNTEISVTLDD